MQVANIIRGRRRPGADAAGGRRAAARQPQQPGGARPPRRSPRGAAARPREARCLSSCSLVDPAHHGPGRDPRSKQHLTTLSEAEQGSRTQCCPSSVLPATWRQGFIAYCPSVALRFIGACAQTMLSRVHATRIAADRAVALLSDSCLDMYYDLGSPQPTWPTSSPTSRSPRGSRRACWRRGAPCWRGATARSWCRPSSSPSSRSGPAWALWWSSGPRSSGARPDHKNCLVVVTPATFRRARHTLHACCIC